MTKKKFCAHRGVSALMPENSLPAFAAALALGADEIEFDVRLTKDDKLVVSHDHTLDRISDGTGFVSEHTLEELKCLNIGAKCGWDLPFCTADEVFGLLAGKIAFNIHLKQHGKDGYLIKELQRLIEKYGAADSVYLAGSPDELYWMEKIAPEIRRVAIQLPSDTVDILSMAKKYACSGVQFWFGLFDKELIDKIHKEGMFCNVFFADDEKKYSEYFDMGIDTILTNRADLAAKYRKDNMC